MAQECGFFNAQMAGEEPDRVYLAEQFAAYFSSFIGNGIFGKSMQQLSVLAQTSANMSVKVLSGQGWINGWWYRNTDEYTLNFDVADGVLNRIDRVVLRWGNQERTMWLHVIKGTASNTPVAPPIVRNADYYDLGLATIAIDKGIVRITQAQITDTRLDKNLCGLVTGVVDQIDTTNLYNQFTTYFNEFKAGHEAEFARWSEAQKNEYLVYIATQKGLYDAYIAQTQGDYDTWTAAKKNAYDVWVAEREADFTTWAEVQMQLYLSWISTQQNTFDAWYNEHTTSWTEQFQYWFNNVKAQLSDDVAGRLFELIRLLDEKSSGYVDRVTHFSEDGKTVTQVSGDDKIVTMFPDRFTVVQEYYTNNIKTKIEKVTFSADGKTVTENKEVM